MLGLSATRQQASTAVDCAQKHSSCTICRDKLHCNDKIIPPAGSLPQLFWACRRRNALRHSHASAATCPKICGQPARFSRQLEALHLDLRPQHPPQRFGQRGSAGGVWLQNEHTQKMLPPHLLLASPVKRRSRRNASALPTFAIASILGAPSIRKSHKSSSRKPI